MEIRTLVWDRKTLDKLDGKHNVSKDEVEQVLFDNPPHIRRWKNVYHAYGETFAGRYLFVVFANLGRGKAKIITAREMTQSERRLYIRQRRR